MCIRDSITCYTKTGADDSSFIVIVAFDLKYKNVDTAAPGLDCFYVKTNEQGKYYIDNVYSPFNMSYQENPIDDTIPVSYTHLDFSFFASLASTLLRNVFFFDTETYVWKPVTSS